MSDVTWCECAEPEMVYHFVNAWEDDRTGHIVIVGVREDGFSMELWLQPGREAGLQYSERGKVSAKAPWWRLDPSNGKVLSEQWLFDDIIGVTSAINLQVFRIGMHMRAVYTLLLCHAMLSLNLTQ